MIQPVSVQARPGYRIWIEFSDGVAGEVDLSDLVGRGVFEAWNEPGCFERVHVAPHRAIAWSDDLELCADALYMEITGITFCGDSARVSLPLRAAPLSFRAEPRNLVCLPANRLRFLGFATLRSE